MASQTTLPSRSTLMIRGRKTRSFSSTEVPVVTEPPTMAVNRYFFFGSRASRKLGWHREECWSFLSDRRIEVHTFGCSPHEGALAFTKTGRHSITRVSPGLGVDEHPAKITIQLKQIIYFHFVIITNRTPRLMISSGARISCRRLFAFLLWSSVRYLEPDRIRESPFVCCPNHTKDISLDRAAHSVVRCP